jgi:hypothetical protein
MERIDGVVLTNKGQWGTRFPTFLCGWDCVSICIFNPKNIIFKEIK